MEPRCCWHWVEEFGWWAENSDSGESSSQHGAPMGTVRRLMGRSVLHSSSSSCFAKSNLEAADVWIFWDHQHREKIALGGKRCMAKTIGFLQIGSPKPWLSILKSSNLRDDLGYPYFKKPTYVLGPARHWNESFLSFVLIADQRNHQAFSQLFGLGQSPKSYIYHGNYSRFKR